MKTLIKKKTTISNSDNLIILCNKNINRSDFNINKEELQYIKKEQQKGKEIVSINQYKRLIFLILPKKEKNLNKNAENCRMIGDNLAEKLKEVSSVLIINDKQNQTETLQIAEGIALGNYRFTKHKTQIREHKFKTIYLCKNSSQKDITELQNLIDAVYFTRNLINEPFSHLKAKDLANLAVKSAQKN
tara:strand:+ start:445 stop:1008 length:564 start_codon:yes stop_codon:yes gene_type:complete